MTDTRQLAQRASSSLFFGSDAVHYDHVNVNRKGGRVAIQASAVETMNQHHTNLYQNSNNCPSNFLSQSGATIDLEIPAPRYLMQSCMVEFTVQCDADTILGTPWWCSDVSILANSNSLVVQRFNELDLYIDNLAHLNDQKTARVVPSMGLNDHSNARTGTF